MPTAGSNALRVRVCEEKRLDEREGRGECVREGAGMSVCQRELKHACAAVTCVQMCPVKISLNARAAREDWRCAHLHAEALKSPRPGRGQVGVGAGWTPAWGSGSETQRGSS